MAAAAPPLRCQNADCGAALDVTPVPVDFEGILRTMFEGAAPGVEPPDYDALRSAARRGENVAFARLVAAATTGPAGVPLPLCDGCLDAALKARARALAGGVERRDAAAAAAAAVAAAAAAAAPAAALFAGEAGAAPAAPLLAPAGAAALAAELAAAGAAADAALAAARRRAAAAAARAAAVRAADARLSRLESAVWRDAAALRGALVAARARAEAVAARDARLRGALGRLRSLSVLSDAFFIWHRGPFVTVCSARLGRLPGAPVDWPEVNAALGQFALVLAATAARAGHAFARYRVVPMGSFARLAPVGEEGGRGVLDAFWDGSFFAASRLSAAVRALLVCLGELGAAAEARDRSFRLPHAVAPGGERVGDVPTAVGRDAAWTRAMKLAAINLKWLVAWVHRQPLASAALTG